MERQTYNGNLIRRGWFEVARIVDSLQFAAPLFTRLVVGITFYYTGHGKLQNLDRTASFFSGLGIPFPAANAAFISSLEYFGGICLMLGLGTRILSAMLSSTMIVALMTADKDTLLGKFPGDLTDVTSFVLLLFLIWLVLYGAGSVSLDRLIGHLAKRQKQDSQARVASQSAV